MFGFIKQCFFTAMTFFGCSVLNVSSVECVSMNIQECKIRSAISNIDTNEPMFYPNSITINKCKGSCNTINDTYAKLCVPDTIKNMNVKVFNLMSRTNETRHIEWHKTCKCKCRFRPPKIACPIRSGCVSGAQTLLRSPKYRARCYVMFCHIVF